jgi:hypothetical protein
MCFTICFLVATHNPTLEILYFKVSDSQMSLLLGSGCTVQDRAGVDGTFGCAHGGFVVSSGIHK